MTHELDVGSGELRTIRLYGTLGARFGRVHRMAVGSLGEAVRALSVQLPEFRRYLMESHDKGVDFAVFYGKRNLSSDELAMQGQGDIRIAPVYRGAKERGLFQIILGVALIAVAAIATSGAAIGWGAATFGSGGIWGTVAMFGFSMALGGVVQMLTPIPKGQTGERPEHNPSKLFSGPVNTQAQGHPVPLLYGELFIGSAVISAGIYTKDQAVIPTDTAVDGGGSYGGGSAPWHLEGVNRVHV